MAAAADIAEFLATRRAKVTPQRAGLPSYPVVGELELSYATLTIDADDGLRLAVCTAQAGSTAQQTLDLLASWTATRDEHLDTGAQRRSRGAADDVLLPPMTSHDEGPTKR